MMNAMPIANSLQLMQDFLDESRLGFVIEPIGLERMPSWKIADGALSHTSRGFFNVVGVVFDGDRGTAPQEALYLYQPQSAINGLLTCRIDGQRHFLLQARAEPGNLGQAQYGPTLQSTPANYLRAHGGKATPYIDLFTTYTPGITILHDSMQLDLGRRYLFKSKRVIVAECAADLPLEEGFIWVPAAVINQAVALPTFLNTDLRALFGVLDWDAPAAGELGPLTAEVAASLAAPPRPEVLARVAEALHGRLARYRFRDIARLDGWEITDRGIRERIANQGFEVGYFHVEARRREVASWQQPLIDSRSRGQATLLCRIADGRLEVLVEAAAEPGLQTGKALLPSHLRYPGAPPEVAAPPGKVVLQTIESDEGGRFHCDASTYEIVLAPSGERSDGIWLRISELKRLLASSNLCTIQLRCLASFLLGELRFEEQP